MMLKTQLSSVVLFALTLADKAGVIQASGNGFEFATLGTNECPSGSTFITSEAQCKLAIPLMPLTTGGQYGAAQSRAFEATFFMSDYPKGCLRTDEFSASATPPGAFDGYWFNSHPDGSADPISQLVCALAPAGAEGDPHITGLHGEHFDMHGKHGAVLNLLSAKNVSLNARVEEHAFNVYNIKVHGSFFVAMFFTLRTNSSGRMTNLEYDPRYPPTIFDKSPVTVSPKVLEMEDVRVRHEDPDSIQLNTSDWSFTITAKSIEYGVLESWSIKQLHTAIKQLRLDLVPLTDPLGHGIAPHGIIGQTADGDDEAIDGKQDDLAELAKAAEKGPGGLKSVHSTAQGEGAIEGIIDDYIVLGNVFETKFKYSRFDASSAPVRDTSKLTGTHRARTSGSVGASGDDSIRGGDQALESA